MSDYGEETESPITNRIEITTLQKLIDEKLLIKPELIRIDDFKEGDVAEPGKGGNMEYLARKIAYHYKKEGWNKTIIFVDRVSSAEELGENLKQKEVPNFVYTSRGYNKDDLEKFCEVGSKDYKIMIAVNMVSEGFDVPDLQTVYLYSKIESQIVLRQRIGRVLRKPENEPKAKATVYWQKYFKEKSGTKNKALFEEETIKNRGVEEKEGDIQKEIRLWRKGEQLPAVMYLEKLPEGGDDERVRYKRYEFLRILDLFGLDEAMRVIGQFDLDGHQKIVGKAEKLGYEQFYRVIRSDYYSVLIYKNGINTFAGYAKALGIRPEELIENIKKTCFYVYDVKKADTEGKVNKPRLAVEDGDLQEFYKWVIGNDICMPPYEPIGNTDDTNSEESEQESSKPESEPYEREKIAELMKKRKKADNLIDGMKLHHKLKRKLAKKSSMRKKNILKYLLMAKAERCYTRSCCRQKQL